MRIGLNPQKDKEITFSDYLHQIIIPVYIPNQEEYFKESFDVFKICLQSLFQTTNKKTFITIVNNGSGNFVKDYLDGLLKSNKIHEVIHTENIGKVNAVLKGLVGNNIELVTISDADVLFLKDWQKETFNVFKTFPKVGVVGLTPQFGMFKSYCSNLIWDNFFNSNFKFLPVKNKEALIQFYDSIGWKRDYNPDYLEYALGLEAPNGLKVLAGSGHFVATYKKAIFENLIPYIGYKMGTRSMGYIDQLPFEKDYWRLTTYDNYAYHMGNVLEEAFKEKLALNEKAEVEPIISFDFLVHRKTSKLLWLIKNKVFSKILRIKKIYKLFLLYKKLPKVMIDTF